MAALLALCINYHEHFFIFIFILLVDYNSMYFDSEIIPMGVWCSL